MPSDASHDDMPKFFTLQSPHADEMPEVELHAPSGFALRCWFCPVWQRRWEKRIVETRAQLDISDMALPARHVPFQSDNHVHMVAQRHQVSLRIHDQHLEVEPPVPDLLALDPQLQPLNAVLGKRLLQIQVHHQRRVPKESVYRKRRPFLSLLGWPVRLYWIWQAVDNITERAVGELAAGS